VKGIQTVSSDEWIEKANIVNEFVPGIKRADTFAPFQQKVGSSAANATHQQPTDRRGVRTVPFLRETFEQIASSFFTHDSIARVVSRSDVPIFTCDKVNMTEPAYGMRLLLNFPGFFCESDIDSI
jgi:hypothetical protein